MPRKTPPSPPAKMQDIAEKLNLSVATVSRSLRRIPGINPQTRARVLQAASEFGYRLPQTYRSNGVKEEKLLHIGILLETTNSNTPHPYLTGISDASMSLNASPAIHYVKPGECERMLDPKHQPRAMRSGLLSGLVLIFWWPREVVKALSEKFPTVSIMHKYSGLDVDMVGIDNEGGMEILVRDLHAKGHRKIAFFGRCGQLHWANARFGGYVAALASLGLEYRPERVVEVDFDAIASIDAKWSDYGPRVEKIMADGVTAWICVTEPAGCELHRWLAERGYRIPEDVSVTGFHRGGGGLDLTSVGASYESIGAAALKRLCHRIHNPAESTRTILFPCEYYPGSTTGPVPKR